MCRTEIREIDKSNRDVGDSNLLTFDDALQFPELSRLVRKTAMAPAKYTLNTVTSISYGTKTNSQHALWGWQFEMYLEGIFCPIAKVKHTL